MSMVASSANVRRRRDRATRRIVESSQSSQAAKVGDSPVLADVGAQDEDWVSDLPFSGQQVYGEIHEDDPQLDLRTQSEVMIDDQDEDVSSEEGATRIYAKPTYTLPLPLQDVERLSIRSQASSPEDYQVASRYTTFLATLCQETATQEVLPHSLPMLQLAISTAQSISLDESNAADPELDLYAHALILHVWLLVWHWLQHNSYPEENESLSAQWASYSLSAHTLVQPNCKVSLEKFIFVTGYWEERLCKMGKGNTWLRVYRYNNIPQMDPDNPCPRNSIADEYMRVLEAKGKGGLALFLLEAGLKEPGMPLALMLDTSEEKKFALAEIIGILNSMDTELIKALVEGLVSKKAAIPGHNVNQVLSRFNPPKMIQPSIYMNSICDGMGISPTPAQWRLVCDQMMEYVGQSHASDEMAAEIDQLIYPSTRWPAELARKGLRRYTEWKSYLVDEDRFPCTGRRDIVRYFVDRMRHRIETEKDHIPLDAPVIEIGFSIDPQKRLREHRRHWNSNYLMNLAQASFQHIFPDMFHLDQHIIYQCYRAPQTWFSEIILTQLAQGYTEGAGGFSHYPVGFSNGSAYCSTGLEAWARFGDTAYKSGTLAAGLEDMIAAAEKRTEKIKATRKEREREREVLDLEIKRQKALLGVIEAMTKFTEAESRLRQRHSDQL